jgi:aspartate-semialdehyde dehydrogenase
MVSIAHPAATILALLLKRAASLGVKSSAVTLFDPVSERGRRGMDELHQQTLNLLGFQPMPKEEFDAQVAFNLLPRYGAEAKQTVESSELRILKHFAGIAPGLARPALQMVQAPTFHGHVASILLELQKPSAIPEVNAALAGEHVTIIGGADEPPSNVSIAGMDSIQVWARQDATRPEALWLWAAADNLKIAGLTACDAGRALAAARPTGKIQ